MYLFESLNKNTFIQNHIMQLSTIPRIKYVDQNDPLNVWLLHSSERNSKNPYFMISN